MLDYSGMTPEQIQDFVDTTSIDAEIDAIITLSPTINGKIEESAPENIEYSYWINGNVLDYGLNDNYHMHPNDLIKKALAIYKYNGCDLNRSRDAFIAYINRKMGW